jgi:hypothetical protein
MIIFTYQNPREYAAALRTIKRIGADHEAQPDDLTIITDELTASERARMTNAYKTIIDATDDAYDLNPQNQAAAHEHAF